MRREILSTLLQLFIFRFYSQKKFVWRINRRRLMSVKQKNTWGSISLSGPSQWIIGLSTGWWQGAYQFYCKDRTDTREQKGSTLHSNNESNKAATMYAEYSTEKLCILAIFVQPIMQPPRKLSLQSSRTLHKASNLLHRNVLPTSISA